MDLLMALEQIIEKAKGSQLSEEFYSEVDKYVKYLSTKLGLTKEQSVMLAIILNKSCEKCLSDSDIGEFVSCSTVRIMRYTNDMDVLEDRGFIRRFRDKRCITYRVPSDVFDAFCHNEVYVPKNRTGLSCLDLFDELLDFFDMRDKHEITYEKLVQKINSLLIDNEKLGFVSQIEKYSLCEEDKMLLVLLSHLFVNNADDHIFYCDLEFLYDDRRQWNRIKHNLIGGTHPLFFWDLIEYNNDDGLVDRESFRLTDKAKSELFSEIPLKLANDNLLNKNLIKCEKIVEKKLFYGESMQNHINELSRLLDESHYQDIQTRLKESGFRCGFTCLFYGAPGTGKTETVLQLARMTGRDIIQVDVSQIKSCWVGESEKNIKKLFDAYKEKVKKSTTTPILLFNEADAIINKRQVGAERAVDKMENSIQNIILQEMESLDGILIATTNLAQNMDKAFERRFLYKIKFEKPTLEARMSIWHEMMPDLSESDTQVLASKYDFSGGQIENIARHYAINHILYGSQANSLDDLISYCENECLETKQTNKIGF